MNMDCVIVDGVFGVLIFVFDGDLFWGEDVIDMFVDCVMLCVWFDLFEVCCISVLLEGIWCG